MRGSDVCMEQLFAMKRLEDFVPADHPLRPIRLIVNEALVRLDGGDRRHISRYATWMTAERLHQCLAAYPHGSRPSIRSSAPRPLHVMRHPVRALNKVAAKRVEVSAHEPPRLLDVRPNRDRSLPKSVCPA
ncbi:hypothetical protein ABIB90_007202 [Bradyrhizobium sp. JR4.1]